MKHSSSVLLDMCPYSFKLLGYVVFYSVGKYSLKPTECPHLTILFGVEKKCKEEHNLCFGVVKLQESRQPRKS